MIFFINRIKDDTYVSAATADTCSMVHLVCLFMTKHMLALLQDNCLDLVCCAFLRKLSTCVRNLTAFCQQLLRAKILAILTNTDILVKPKYRPDVSARLTYRSISSYYESESKICFKTIISIVNSLHTSYLLEFRFNFYFMPCP